MVHRFALLAIAAAILALPATSGAKPAKKHLLVVSYAAGFAHSSRATGEQVLAELGEKSGIFDVAYCRTAEDVKTMLTPEGLSKFDGVFFDNTTGNLGIPDLHAFLDWIKAGHAFFGVHSATDTYHPRDINGDTSYVDMIGAEFKTHGAQAEVDAIVNDPKHPAVKDLVPDWKVRDEIYEWIQNPRPNVHVLLSLTRHPNDGHPQAGQPEDHPLAWCNMYGKGRVFYTAFGHREDVWENPIFQKHLLGGIKWGFGLAKGSAVPNNPAPKE